MTTTATDLITTVREVATKNPGHVYFPEQRSCRYRDSDGSAGCLIGHALERLHLLEVIPSDGPENTSSIEIIAPHLGVTGSEEDITWLTRVQNEQDGGYSWGEAVQRADSGMV